MHARKKCPGIVTIDCYAMLCYAMLCYAMLCYAKLSYAVLCYDQALPDGSLDRVGSFFMSEVWRASAASSNFGAKMYFFVFVLSLSCLCLVFFAFSFNYRTSFTFHCTSGVIFISKASNNMQILQTVLDTVGYQVSKESFWLADSEFGSVRNDITALTCALVPVLTCDIHLVHCMTCLFREKKKYSFLKLVDIVLLYTQKNCLHVSQCGRVLKEQFGKSWREKWRDKKEKKDENTTKL